MQCPKCGAEITQNDIVEDGAVRCPGCGAIYRRKAPVKNIPEQTGQAAEPSAGMKRADRQAIKEKTHYSGEHIGENGLTTLWKLCAWIIYAGAFILGCIAQYNTSASILRYIKGFSTISMVSIWVTGFIYGTIALSIGEVIQLLHEINEKQSRER